MVAHVVGQQSHLTSLCLCCDPPLPKFERSKNYVDLRPAAFAHSKRQNTNQTHSDGACPLLDMARGSGQCLAYGDEGFLNDQAANKTSHRGRTESPGWSQLAKIQVHRNLHVDQKRKENIFGYRLALTKQPIVETEVYRPPTKEYTSPVGTGRNIGRPTCQTSP